MDVLSSVLQAVRLTGAVFFDVRASDPVVAETPPMAQVGSKVMPNAGHVIPFHIMMRGRCWVECTETDDAPIEFSEGDIVIYPQGHAHAFVSHIGDRAAPDLAAYRRPDEKPLPFRMGLHGNGPATMHFVCGYLGCDAGPFNPLLNALPNQLLAKRCPEGAFIESDLIRVAVEESDSNRAGAETILARLSELLFVRVLRRYIEQLPDHSTGWLASLKDPALNRALQLIHGQPARDWTLEDLAREAGMSRTAFTERFTGRVGETPMRYLGRWRMQLATQMLREPGRSIDDIAGEVGYQSEAAFNRAFKNIVGMPPGSWRRSQGRALSA